MRLRFILAPLVVIACAPPRPATAPTPPGPSPDLPAPAGAPAVGGGGPSVSPAAAIPPSAPAAAAANESVPAVPPNGRRMSADEIAAAQRRGTAVDTITVHPLRVELRVGEVYPLGGFGLVARDTTGRVVRNFGPAFILPARDVVEFADGGLRGRAPGTAVIYVEALPREPGQDPRPRRPSTRVDVVVRP